MMDTAAGSKRSSRQREISPDRAKVCMKPKVKPIKKVQVVYYLSRNGQLEHPHYMEVTHFANHHLRLKDVMDRLTVLRGKGMPSLYSWSCKRSYKNGYVWNDLAENDVIYPSDGAEYVLKGSELVEGCSERFQQLQVTNSSNRQLIQEPHLHAKAKQLAPSQTHNIKFEFEDFEEDQGQESQEEYEDEEKTSYTSSTTPHSRCSRGVSTDELEEPKKNPTTESTRTTESTKHHSSPSPPPPSLTCNKQLLTTSYTDTFHLSKRFEDGDPISTESPPGRNSVLLQLISCGNLAVAKAKNNAAVSSNSKQEPRKVTGGVNMVIKRSESNLHKGVLYKSAVKVAEEDVMIKYMSENPRFGNLQAEEKAYFSGSIVESMSENRDVAESAGLKRSNSYNEERSTKLGGAEEEEEEEEVKEKGGRGKCIPRKMVLSSSSSSKQTKKIM